MRPEPLILIVVAILLVMLGMYVFNHVLRGYNEVRGYSDSGDE